MQNARPFEKPFQQTRDTVRFLRAALAGGHATATTRRSRCAASSCAARLDVPPPILVAALREGMLELAGREADGAILNYVTPEDVAQLIAHRAQVRRRQGDRGAHLRVPDARRRERCARSRAGRSPLPLGAHLSRAPGMARQRAATNGDVGGWPPPATSRARAPRFRRGRRPPYIHGPAEYCRARIAAYLDAGSTPRSSAWSRRRSIRARRFACSRRAERDRRAERAAVRAYRR